MKLIAVTTLIVGMVGWTMGGEVGTRFEIGEIPSGVGWLHLAGDVGTIRLSGRVEGDLLCGCLRRLQLGATTTWGDLSAGAETGVLASGRMDVSATGSYKPVWGTNLGLISSQIGGKATVVDALGGRFLTGAGWASVRLDRDPWWMEANVNLAWPGGNPFGELRLGVTGARGASLSVSTSGVGLELGGETGGLSIQSSFSLYPVFQTVAIGIKVEQVRIQGRVTVRPQGRAMGSIALTATEGLWSGSVIVSLSETGLDKVTAEVRYAVGK